MKDALVRLVGFGLAVGYQRGSAGEVDGKPLRPAHVA